MFIISTEMFCEVSELKDSTGASVLYSSGSETAAGRKTLLSKENATYACFGAHSVLCGLC